MSLTDERITEQVAEMVDSIRSGLSFSLAQHSADRTLAFIEDVYAAALISSEQHRGLSENVKKAIAGWQEKPDSGHLFTDDFT